MRRARTAASRRRVQRPADPLGTWLESAARRVPGASTPTAELYMAYLAQAGPERVTQRVFAERLVAEGYPRLRRRAGTHHAHILLR